MFLDEKQSQVAHKMIKNSNNNIYTSSLETNIHCNRGKTTFTEGTFKSDMTWTQFHNTLIRPRFNPIYFMQNLTYF